MLPMLGSAQLSANQRSVPMPPFFREMLMRSPPGVHMHEQGLPISSHSGKWRREDTQGTTVI
eukprot:scaffold60038_cov30-Tisochrysis_lutea.AAC.2